MTIKCANVNIRKAALKKIPILQWMPKYKLGDVLSDLVAGVTVGLTLIPQAIAYAALAGLQPQYGLYSGFAGSLMYIFFGTVKQVNIGPTAVISLLTYNYTHGTNPDFAVLLCFLSGIVEFLSGLLRLGCVVEFVSVPVTAGFSSAAALIIASSQVKGLLGIKIESENFLETWMEIFRHLPDTKPWDLTLSIGCCSVLLGMRKLKDLKVNYCGRKELNAVVNQVTWLLSTSRNAIVVIACAGLAYFLTQHAETPFRLTGTIQSGFPKVALPPFSTTVGNQTYGFLDMCSHLGSGIIVVPLVSLLNNVAIAKAFATEDVFDGTQEMMTLGLCNMVASFFRSMPVSGSFSRSAVNNASGVRSPLGGLYTGCLVILALGFLTPYFFYIPKATLASVIVCAVIFMLYTNGVVASFLCFKVAFPGFSETPNNGFRVQVRHHLNRILIYYHFWVGVILSSANVGTLRRGITLTIEKDLIPAFATFIACLWNGVEIGILVGLAVDILYVLYLNARPKCQVESRTGPDFQDYKIFCPKSGLIFPNVSYIRTKIIETVNHCDLPLVIDCNHVSVLDFSAIQGLKATINDMKKRNRKIIFYKLNEEMSNLLSSVIGPDFVHLSTDLDQTNKEFFDSLRTSPPLSPEPNMDIEIHKLKQQYSSVSNEEEHNR